MKLGKFIALFLAVGINAAMTRIELHTRTVAAVQECNNKFGVFGRVLVENGIETLIQVSMNGTFHEDVLSTDECDKYTSCVMEHNGGGSIGLFSEDEKLWAEANECYFTDSITDGHDDYVQWRLEELHDDPLLDYQLLKSAKMTNCGHEH